MENNVLMHHGVRGMKWGVRRFQNKDGTLTAAGKKRYEKEMAKLKEEEKVVKNREKVKAQQTKLEQKKAALEERKRALDEDEKKPAKKTPAKESKPADPRQKTLSELDDRELEAVVRRMNLEERYKQLNPPQVSAGRKFVNQFRDDVLLPAAKAAGKDVMTKILKSGFTKAASKMGLDVDGDVKDTAAKKTVDTVGKQAKNAANTVKRNYDKAKSKSEPAKTTWVNDDDWWNTPGSRDSSQNALPSPSIDVQIGKKKKKRK